MITLYEFLYAWLPDQIKVIFLGLLMFAFLSAVIKFIKS